MRANWLAGHLTPLPRALSRIPPTLLALLAASLALVSTARAATATECTLDKFCYCVDTGLKGVIDRQVAEIRDTLAKHDSALLFSS